MSTRRKFLAKSLAAVGGLSIADSLWGMVPLSAAEVNVTPDLVQLSADIEPLVRLIEETPREQCFAMIAEQLRRGLPYRQFLAALYLAGIRNVNPQPPGFKFHCVFVIHAAHQLSLDAAVEDRLLPLFWALDDFKVSQQKDVEEGDFRLRPVTGELPSATTAWREFHSAMNEWDQEKADRAMVALVRSESSQSIIGQLWALGARDYRNIGHKAIFVTNSWRTLQTIGWRHAEPALRSLVLGLLDFGRDKRVNDYAFEDQSYLSNLELVREWIGQLPGDWTKRGTGEATLSILDSFRSGSAHDACLMALHELHASRAAAGDVWDAIHLAAGELMLQQPGIYGIHTVTSSSALRYAFESAADPSVRLLMLLQGLGWMCQFRKFMAGKPQGLRPEKITDLNPVEGVPPDVERTFAMIGKDAAAAATQAMTFARQPADAKLFMQTANRVLLHKATDAHDFKYPASIFEDYYRIGNQWQPHLLAAATYHLHGTTAPDSAVMQRAREVVQQIGTH